jgi:hypothetical protein
MVDSVKAVKTLFVELDIEAVNSKNQIFSRRSFLYSFNELTVNLCLILLLKAVDFYLSK